MIIFRIFQSILTQQTQQTIPLLLLLLRLILQQGHFFYICLDEGYFNESVVDEVTKQQYNKSEELQEYGSQIRDFPQIIRFILTSRKGDDDTDDPHKQCSGHITNGPSQGIDGLGDSDTGDVEYAEAQEPEYDEQEEQSVVCGFGEVGVWSLEEPLSTVIEGTCFAAEGTWYEGEYRDEYGLHPQSEQPLEPYYLEGLEVVLGKQFLFIDVEEAIGQEGGQHEGVAQDLQSGVCGGVCVGEQEVGEADDEDADEGQEGTDGMCKLNEDFEEETGEDEGGDNGASLHHLKHRPRDEVECSVLEGGGDQVIEGRNEEEHAIELDDLAFGTGLVLPDGVALGVPLPLHPVNDEGKGLAEEHCCGLHVGMEETFVMAALVHQLLVLEFIRCVRYNPLKVFIAPEIIITDITTIRKWLVVVPSLILSINQYSIYYYYTLLMYTTGQYTYQYIYLYRANDPKPLILSYLISTYTTTHTTTTHTTTHTTTYTPKYTTTHTTTHTTTYTPKYTPKYTPTHTTTYTTTHTTTYYYYIYCIYHPLDQQKQGTEMIVEMGEAVKLDVDSIISSLLQVRSVKPGKMVKLAQCQILGLIRTVKTIFMQQAMLVEVSAPVKVCGDIHGQYYDMLRLFEYGGLPPDSSYLFLGDYVDRGRQGIESICLLFAFKIKYPDRIHILRGNHESASITRIYGFYEECKTRYTTKMWKVFVDCFNCMPVAALIEDKILCMHGGLSPDLTSLEEINAIARPTDIPDVGMLCDLLWADPDTLVKMWGESERGVSYVFGSEVISSFLRKNQLDLICRAHQVVEDGYQFFAKKQLVTVFSAPNYCGEFNNSGAMMRIDQNLMCSFQVLRPVEKAGNFKNNRPKTPIKRGV